MKIKLFNSFIVLTLFLLCHVGTVQGQSIQSFTLINASTDQVIGSLSDGDEISSSQTISIRADAGSGTASVKFYVNGSYFSTENQAPYALAGDTNGDYNAWNPGTGTYTIKAEPYSGSNGSGSLGTTKSIQISIVDQTTSVEPSSDTGTGEVQITGELKKWHKVTLSLDGPFHSETDVSPNPFLDYRLEVTFTNGSKTYKVPGYFAADGNAGESSANSGNTWRVHFTPDATGTWNYSVSFRVGDKAAISDLSTPGNAVSPLDGITGSFNIGNTDKSGRDFRGKGRLKYVGKHHLQFQETGEYFLKGGADAPENFLAYEDFDNTPDNGGRRKSWSPHGKDWNSGDPSWKNGKGTEIIGALNYLASEGLNVFSFLTMNINGDDKNVYPYVSSSDFKHFDCSKLDQWEKVFEHAGKKGLYLHFKTQETENDQLLDGGSLGTDRKLYYRELIARFAHHLALNWNLGEENTNTDQQRKDFAAYFAANDPYQHNIVVHTYPGKQETIYRPLLGSNSKLTGVSIQTGWNNVYSETLQWVNESASSGKKWIVANDEQGSHKIGVPPDDYTGTPNKDNIRKETLWGNLMAGGAGVEYYFGYSLPHSDLTLEDFRSRDISWDYVRHALTFFKKHVPFWNMKSNESLISKGWCLAKEGEAYVVYLPYGGTADLNVGSFNKSYSVQWYDPRNGGSLINGSKSAISGTGNQNIGYPPHNTSQDWVALIKAGSTDNTTAGYLDPLTSTINFGSVDVGNQTSFDLMLENTGNASLEIQKIELAGNTTHFSVNTNLPVNLNSGSSTTIQVNFKPVSSGTHQATISFVHTGSNSPLQCTLEGSGNSTTTDNTSSVAVNAGGGSNSGFEGDTYFTGGSTYSVTNAIQNTSQDALYQSERYGDVVLYDIPVSNGTYKVRLHFAEIYYKDAGKRVFDGYIENNLVLDNFDICSEVGAYQALIKEFQVDVADQVLNVELKGILDNAKISAIEVIPVESGMVINTGGDAIADLGAMKDTYFKNGRTYKTSASILNTTKDAIYQSERYGNPVNYSVPLPNGQHTVKLHFAEIYFSSSGKRVFDVYIENNLVLDNLDIFSEVGKNYALVKEFQVDVADGTLNIDFNAIADNAKISAIEIISGSTTTDNNTNNITNINVGGDQLTFGDKSFDKDAYFNGWRTYSTSSSIANTDNDKLYQSERFGGVSGNPLNYTIPVTAGNYDVTLHFAELYWTASGKRIFDVYINNSMVLEDFDIYAEAGKNKAITKTFTVSSSGDYIKIDIIASLDYGKLSGIEIVPSDGTITEPTTGTDTGTTTDCNADFVEKNGLVVAEIESKSASGWKSRTDVTGYTGASFYEWTGGDKFNSPGSGLLEYKVQINTPGTYRFQWHSKVGTGTSSTEHNDSWLRIPDADDFYGQKSSHIVRPKGVCSGDCPNGSGSGGWFKIYSSGTTNWTWSTNTSDNDPHSIYARFDQAGVYTIQISGRSNGHFLDRFVLYNSSVSKADATNLSQSETRCQSGTNARKIEKIQEEEFYQVKLYPNPASDRLLISLGDLDKDVPYTIHLIDVKGTVYFRDEYTIGFEDKYAIDLTKLGLNKGLYILTIQNNETKHYLKFYKE